MTEYPQFNRYPELKEIIYIIRNEIQRAQRPPHEVILDDEDVMRMLKISKRKLQYMKANLEIPFSRPKPYPACYYLLSDILEWINNDREESIANQRKV